MIVITKQRTKRKLLLSHFSDNNVLIEIHNEKKNFYLKDVSDKKKIQL